MGPRDQHVLAGWEVDGSVGVFNDFGGHRDPQATEGGALIVERCEDGVPLGLVSWHRVPYGPNRRSAALNIGINLIPSARGMGYGREAQSLLATHLFATTGVNRIEASTDVENVAEQRSLAAAGFTREGVLRGAQHRAGAWHDLVLYSRLREEEEL